MYSYKIVLVNKDLKIARETIYVSEDKEAITEKIKEVKGWAAANGYEVRNDYMMIQSGKIWYKEKRLAYREDI